MKLNKKNQIEEIINQIIVLKTQPPTILTKKTIQHLQQKLDKLSDK